MDNFTADTRGLCLRSVQNVSYKIVKRSAWALLNAKADINHPVCFKSIFTVINAKTLFLCLTHSQLVTGISWKSPYQRRDGPSVIFADFNHCNLAGGLTAEKIEDTLDRVEPVQDVPG